MRGELTEDNGVCVALSVPRGNRASNGSGLQER